MERVWVLGDSQRKSLAWETIDNFLGLGGRGGGVAGMVEASNLLCPFRGTPIRESIRFVDADFIN